MNIPDLCRAYIGAGGDPARFWELTPQLYLIELEGLAERHKRERAMIWHAAALHRVQRLPEFDGFVSGGSRRMDVKAWVSAWDKVDRALIKNRKRA